MKVFVILFCILVALNVILAKSYDKKHEKGLERSKSPADWSSDKYQKDFGKKIMKRSPKWRNEFSKSADRHEDSNDWSKVSKHSQKKPHKVAKRSVSEFDEENYKKMSKKHHVEKPSKKEHKRSARDIRYVKDSKHDFVKNDSGEVSEKKKENSNSVFREFPSHEIHVDKKSNKNSKKFEKASKKAKQLLKADDSEEEITKVASQKVENSRKSRDDKKFKKNSSEESEEKVMMKDQKKKHSEESQKSSEEKKDSKKTAKRSPSSSSSESIEDDSDEKIDRASSKKPEKSPKSESAEEVSKEIPSKSNEIPSAFKGKEDKQKNLTDSAKKVLENAPLEFTEAQKMFPSAPVLDLKVEDQAINASQPQVEAESGENGVNSKENIELSGKPVNPGKAPENSSQIPEKTEPTMPSKPETDSKNQEAPLNPPVVPGKVEISSSDNKGVQKKPQIYSSMLNTAHISATCFCSHSDHPENYTIVVFKDEIDCSSFNCAHQALHCKVEKNEVVGFTVSADQQVSKGHSSLRFSCSGFPLVREISFESTYLAEKETMVNSVETGPDNGNITVILKVLPMQKIQFTGTRNSWSPFQIFTSWFPKFA